jgi:hypothetical protein
MLCNDSVPMTAKTLRVAPSLTTPARSSAMRTAIPALPRFPARRRRGRDHQRGSANGTREAAYG